MYIYLGQVRFEFYFMHGQNTISTFYLEDKQVNTGLVELQVRTIWTCYV